MSQTSWQRSEEKLETATPETKPDTEPTAAPIIDLTGARPDRTLPADADDAQDGPDSDEQIVSDGASQREALSEESLPSIEDLDGSWVTVATAARLLQVSETTVRRRVAAGRLRGQLVHDPSIGSRRWVVHNVDLPEENLDASATLVPIEAIDRLEAAWQALREATARAERAERVAEFEKERRVEAEYERNRLRELQSAESALTERVVRLEKDKRAQVEKERDRLRAMLDSDAPVRKSRWKAFTDSLRTR